MHPEIAGSGPSRRWIPVAAVSFVLAAVVATVVVVWAGRDDPHPERVAREFLDARTGAQLWDLADDRLDARLDRRSCETLLDAAKGRRTYRSPDTDRHLTRDLRVDDVSVDGHQARVSVTVSYSGEAASPRDERVVVELVRTGKRWLVDDYGIAR